MVNFKDELDEWEDKNTNWGCVAIVALICATICICKIWGQ